MVIIIRFPEEQDKQLMDRLKLGDSYTTDIEQARRFSKLGYTIKRTDRHLISEHLIETTIPKEVFDNYNKDFYVDMLGDKKLNRP
jgi:hypothetical protein